METECLQKKQNEMQHYLGGKGKDRVMLIKSLIYLREEKGACGARYKRSKESQSNYIKFES